MYVSLVVHRAESHNQLPKDKTHLNRNCQTSSCTMFDVIICFDRA